MLVLSAESDKNFNNFSKKIMTTKEVAEKLHCENKTIFNIAKKCLPNKKIENGKQTFWSEAEITILIEQMKTSQPNQHNLVRSIQGVSTELTPALKIKKAFDLMQEGYEEELAILKAKNLEQQKIIAEQKPKAECFDNFLARDKFCNFRDASNYLGITQTNFMNLLKSKYIYKNKIGEYRAYSDYSEYFTLRPYEKGYNKVGQQLMLNIKGLEYFKKQYAMEVSNA